MRIVFVGYITLEVTTAVKKGVIDVYDGANIY